VTHARMAIPGDLWNSARHVQGEQVSPPGVRFSRQATVVQQDRKPNPPV
jgi:hypothetical protein